MIYVDYYIFCDQCGAEQAVLGKAARKSAQESWGWGRGRIADDERADSQKIGRIGDLCPSCMAGKAEGAAGKEQA